MSPRLSQTGAATLLVVVVLLFAMSLIVAYTLRSALTEHRLAGNVTNTDAAASETDAGLQNALAYLIANKKLVTSTSTGGWNKSSSNPHWQPCSSTLTALPCGDGTVNLYGSNWSYYGPVPNQQNVTGSYTHTTWYVSNSINTTWTTTPFLGCTNLALTGVLPALTVTLLGTVNTLLHLISPSLGVPANVCLPINFSSTPVPASVSSDNPAIIIVTRATDATDTRAATADAQLYVKRSGLLSRLPIAALTASGTVNLSGDVRIWGNPRPPTTSPYDFSILKLQDVAGLNVTGALDSYLGGGQAATLAPLLNLTLAEVLALDWYVTFPLSIWSSSTATLQGGAVGLNILNSARTCTPPFDASTSTCLPLSWSVSIPAGSIALFTPLVGVNLPLKLPDVQDPQNLVSTVTGLLSTTPAPTYPADLFNFIFGVPSASYLSVKAEASVLSDCSGFPSEPLGFYWVTGSCTLSGSIGSGPSGPIILVVDGNLTLTSGSTFYGMVYLRGGGTKTVTGATSASRPLIQGALLADGNVTSTDKYNLVFDSDQIRRASFISGKYAPAPGGWSDKLAAP